MDERRRLSRFPAHTERLLWAEETEEEPASVNEGRTMARYAANSAAEGPAPVAADAGAQEAEASSTKGEGRAVRPAAQASSRRSRTAQGGKHSKRSDAVSKVSA